MLKEELKEQLKYKEELYYRLLNLEIKYKEKNIRYAFLDNKKYGISIDELPVEIELLLEPSPIKINLPKVSRDKKVELYTILID